MIKSSKLILIVGCLFILGSCSRGGKKRSYNAKNSSTTGWEYNNSKNGGFETNIKYKEETSSIITLERRTYRFNFFCK